MSELYHYGVKGMHWGVRRYQNADGSLTAAGRARYNTGSAKGYKGASNSNEAWKAQRKRVIESRTKGGNVATVLANGPFGAYTYNSLRAAGDSRGTAYAKTILSSALGGPIGNAVMAKLAKSDYLDGQTKNSNGYKGVANKQSRAEKKEIKAAQKFDKEVSKNWYKAHNKAADQFNKDIVKINEKYKGVDLGWNGETYASSAGQRYVKEVSKLWKTIYKDATISEFGNGPTSIGKDWVNNMPLMDTYDSLLTKK